MRSRASPELDDDEEEEEEEDEEPEDLLASES
jgi:hypothetical protein